MAKSLKTANTSAQAAARPPAGITFTPQENSKFGRFSKPEYAVMPRRQVLLPEEPQSINLACLRDPALRIKKAFTVNFAKESGQTLAAAVEVEEYGIGANETEARQDLQHAIASLYHSLQEDQEILGPGLQETWDTLQEHIRPYPEEK